MPVKMEVCHRPILTPSTAKPVVLNGITTHYLNLENLRNHTIHQNIGNQEHESYLRKESKIVVCGESRHTYNPKEISKYISL